MGPISVVVQDSNNLVLEVTPTASTTIILDRGIPGPMGAGDVDGPALSTIDAIAVFNDTTGKVLRNSNLTIVGSNLNGVGGIFADDLNIAVSFGQYGNFTKNNFSITGWSYNGVSKSIAAEETNATGLFFKPDGTKMYVSGSTGDDVNEYALSTAWDITTATFTSLFSIAAQDTATADMFFKPDGLAFYILGDTSNAVFQYTIGTAWDITTSSYASKTFSVAGQDTSPSGLWFKPDGLIMYVAGNATDTIYQYALGTAWDVSTASYSSISFSVASQETGISGLNISSSGSTIYVIGTTGDDINSWSLSSAWDISTAFGLEKFYVGFQAQTPTAMFIADPINPKAFVVDATSDVIYQYETTGSIAIKQINQNSYFTGYTRINNNFYVDGSAKIDGTLAVDGALTTAGSVSFGNITASNITATQITTTSTAITLGGSITTGATTVTSTQTTGLITVGGTAGTGAITIGQSTAAQTVNVANGATATATAKTVNVGTAGLSAVSGATSTTSVNGNAIISVTDNTNAALRITQLGTGNALLVEDSANPDATPFAIDSAGRLIQGYTTAILTADDYNGTNRTAWGYQGNSSNAACALYASWNTSATVGAGISLSRSKSATVGTPTIVALNDSLGGIGFNGDDGANFIVAASITCEVDAAPALNDMPGRLLFNTTPDGASTPVERVRIDNAGNVQASTGAIVQWSPAPAAISAATTLTNANIQGQIISATGTTYTITMPLGSTMETLVPWAAINVGYDFYVINTASGIITMAVNTGVTSLGSLTVSSGASAQFRIRRTATNTFILYRLS